MMIRPCVFLLLLTFYFGTLDAQDKPPFTSMDVFELEWVSDPQISPDGDYIVYERKSMDIMEDKRVSRIWMIKADGTEHQKLSSNDVSESKPRWSPDGTRIAFVSSTEEGSELFVYWLKTNKIARLSQLENSPANLAWSPDGK
ncbi:MAG: Tol biopolymer transport system component, partial [Saprospiraceae bacterium]